jgi:molecular chaperone Hsp33
MMRYQGLVALDADSLGGAFEDYFAQSEQLPTRVLLAADRNRAAALMIQQLPEGHGDADGWARSSAMFETLGSAELLSTADETLLFRLFHEDGVRLMGRRTLSFACSCSRERVEDTLRTLGLSESLAAARDGLAQVHCDFCGQAYEFSEPQILGLFQAAGANAPGSERLQ